MRELADPVVGAAGALELGVERLRQPPRDLRDLAEQMQQQAARQGYPPPGGGRVIEGEVNSSGRDEANAG